MEKSIDLQGSGIYLRKRNREVTEYWDRKQVGDNKTMVFKVLDIKNSRRKLKEYSFV